MRHNFVIKAKIRVRSGHGDVEKQLYEFFWSTNEFTLEWSLNPIDQVERQASEVVEHVEWSNSGIYPEVWEEEIKEF